MLGPKGIINNEITSFTEDWKQVDLIRITAGQ